MSVRLVRTQSEIEGRVSELWTLVDDEDNLETWSPEDQLSVVGRPAPRADGPVRVAGRANYAVDVQLPGMLQAVVLRSPVGHGHVRRLDLEAPLELEGVRAVLGPDDSGQSDGDPLFVAEPTYAGQPIAAVAADTLEKARAAIDALDLELDVRPHVHDAVQAVRDMRFAVDPREYERGNAEAALTAAEVTIEFEVETPDHIQTPFEPHAAVAQWVGDELTVWLSTQGMFDARRQLARRFGLPVSQVRVISEYVGGGFGAKQAAGFEAITAAELARMTGRPVRLVNDRHDEYLDGGRRAATRQTIRLGAHRDGTLAAVEVEAIVDHGQRGLNMLVGVVVNAAATLYACDNVRTATFAASTNRRGQNAFRAPGMTEGITALEQAMDELAVALEMDPLEFRRRNHVDHDQLSGTPYSGKHLLACYDRAAEIAGWDARHNLREPQLDGLLRGMGCASQIWFGSGGPTAHATVLIDAAGLAHVTTGIQDVGTGTLTAAQLVAAEELGFALADVRVVGGDTAANVYGPVAAGSTTVPSVMPAVRAAAAKARRTLLQLASDVVDLPVAELVLRSSRVRSRDGALDIPVTDVTEMLGDATIDASGARVPNTPGAMVQTFGCQIAQVAVDPSVGEIKVERIVAVHDIGRVINPLGASSQVEGGVLQAMGYALSEEQIVDPTTGVPVNAHLDDYKLPTIADAPEIVVDFVDISDDFIPVTGARGLGEPPIIPTAAAIANAFAHATGCRCKALPMTRARVFEALR